MASFLISLILSSVPKLSTPEPHSPLVILERGRLTFSQYEQQICSRRDFIRCARKELEPEKKVSWTESETITWAQTTVWGLILFPLNYLPSTRQIVFNVLIIHLYIIWTNTQYILAVYVFFIV